MANILANDGIAAGGKKTLEEAGHKVVTEKVEQDQLVDAINNENYEVLLVRSATKVRKDLIDACPGLKMIGRGGVGMDNIDVEYAREKGIQVFNTPASSSESVAELTIAHLFNMVRFLYDANRKMPAEGAENFKALKKSYGKGTELRGKTLGIIGLGRIGRETAKRALGLGMRVIYNNAIEVDPKVSVELNSSYNASVEVELESVSKEELFKQSDFITLHIPFSGGEAVIGKSEFDQMKDGVSIVNVARGGVIDEDALLEALESGKLSSAALDVFENEPTPDKRLLEHDKISLSPHIGAATSEAQSRIGDEIAENILDYYNS